MIITLRGVKCYIIVSAILLALPCPLKWMNQAREDFYSSLVVTWSWRGAINLVLDVSISGVSVILLRALAKIVSRRKAGVLFCIVAILVGTMASIGHTAAHALVQWIKYFAIMLVVDLLLPSKGDRQAQQLPQGHEPRM